MGSVVSGIFGGGKAASSAADAQVAAAEKAIEFQRESLDKNIKFSTESRDMARSDLQPFRDVGATDLQGLSDLVTNPTKQAEFIQNNPFFDALAKRSTDTLMNNAAAKGKVGSGSTAEALQNSLLLLGSDLLNQNIGQRQNLATLGANAASGQATATQNTASNVSNVSQNASNNISGLMTDVGNAQASGIVGKQNANAQMAGNLIGTGLQAWSLSDVRMKEDIHPVGKMNNGIPIYAYRYKGDDVVHIGPMAQEVETIMPDAVMEHNGLKYVNMEKVWH